MKQILVSGFCTEDKINNVSYFGGAAGGIALNLAGEKVPVGILSILGKDSFSEKYLSELQKREVNLSLLKQIAERLPLLTVVSQENSERSRTFEDFGCKKLLASLEPEKNLLAKSQILHVVNTPQKLCDYLAENFEGIISYCPGSFLMRDPDNLSQHLLQRATYIFCNEEEYEILSEHTQIEQLFSGCLELFCLTKGEKGITVHTSDQTIHLPSIAVEHIVDTTGAGDAIVVGFLAALAHEKAPLEGIKKGQLLATRVVQKRGVTI